jgi:hypothetical protein
LAAASTSGKASDPLQDDLQSALIVQSQHHLRVLIVSATPVFFFSEKIQSWMPPLSTNICHRPRDGIRPKGIHGVKPSCEIWPTF